MYVIRVRSGFCDYFVQDLEAKHVRLTCRRDFAVEFRAADEARKHARSGEEVVYTTAKHPRG
jgi:hypothetical protein